MPLQTANTTRRDIDLERIEKVILQVIEHEGCTVGSVEAVFCGNRMIRRINREFLMHDYATDTITFRYNEGKEIEGEFYISLDVIGENARRFGATFGDELMRVVIHSSLHLVGYDDGTGEARAAMTRKEDHYLQLQNQG